VVAYCGNIPKFFSKRMGKDTKSLLRDMMVSWSKFEPGIPEYKQEASEFQSNFSTCNFSRGKGKAVPLQAWSCPEGSRKLRFPDFMTKAQDGGKVVSLTHRPPLRPGNTPGTHFCQSVSRPQGHSATGRIMSLKNSNDINGFRTRDSPVCSVVS
jgi:hypothetical protein